MRHDHQRTCTFRDTRSFVHLYCFALPHASSPSPAALRNQWQPTKVRRAFPLRPLRKARTRLNNLPPPPQARPPLPQTFPMPMRQMLLAFNRSSSRKRAGGQKMATCITACRLPRYSQLLEKRIKRMRGKESSSRRLLAKTNHLIANRHIWLAGLRFPSFRHR